MARARGQPMTAALLRRFSERQLLAAIIALALLARLPFALAPSHDSVDLDAFARWVRLIQTRDLTTIYDGTRIDYPPLSIYLFAALGWLESQLPDAWRAGDGALRVLLKFPSIIGDLLTVGVIALALRGHSARTRTGACALYAFNPAIVYVTAYWAQLDALYTLFLVGAVVLLARNRVAWAWLAFTLALAIKLQSLALAPLLIIATWRRHGARSLFVGISISVMAGALIALPWLRAGRLGDLASAITTVVPRVDDSAYNFWYLLLRGRVHDFSSELHPLSLPWSYKAIGSGLFVAFAALVGVLLWRRRASALAVAAALLNMGLFMFLTEVHERYLFPTIAFALLAAVGWDEPHANTLQRARWLMFALLTLTFLFNLMSIASPAPSLWTNVVATQPPYTTLILILKGLALVVAAINCVVFVGLMVELMRADQGAGRMR
ncbi:MAG: hypothetical protein ABI874_02715 [Chloroflexota bacterium]